MKYTANDIVTLSFKEAVRTQIDNYLDSADNEGTYQGIKEILNNSTDEANNGFGNKIIISLNPSTNTISIEDFGRGLPQGLRDDGSNVLIAACTEQHTGGKMKGKSTVYKNASGLHGLGLKCVCLSSSEATVVSYRDGNAAEVKLIKGDVVSYNERKTKRANGTIVTFRPDEEVFYNEKLKYDYARICEMIHQYSFLNSNIEFIVRNTETNDENKYYSKNGISDYIKSLNITPLHKSIIMGSAEDGTDSVEIAFQWTKQKEKNVVFVNGLLVPEGGTPITGARTAITKTFNSLAKTDFAGDNIRANMCFVIKCTVADPSFGGGQSKSKINNPSLRTLASNAFSTALKQMSVQHADEFETITELLRKITKAEAAADRAREQVLNATYEVEKNQKKKVFASTKLKDAEFLGQDSILLIVEGDSAAGSMQTARDVKKYGILAIRGKMINCLAHTDEKIYANEEINLLLSAMNIVPGRYNPSKLRYGKIAICTDSDSDGYHIGLLIMSALRKLAPQFINEGRLCWLRSPLYIVNDGKREHYYFSDREMDEARPTLKGEVTRAKGLGALSAERARASMFDEKVQRMDTIIASEEALLLLEALMGEDVAPRKEFIFSKIDFSEVRE